MQHDPIGESNVPLNANGDAYTASQSRHGVPLDYVGEKLESAIKELHAYAQDHSGSASDLAGAMLYLLTAHLALHNMLAKANDRALVKRLLGGTRSDLQAWLLVIAREGDVRGLATLDDEPE